MFTVLAVVGLLSLPAMAVLQVSLFYQQLQANVLNTARLSVVWQLPERLAQTQADAQRALSGQSLPGELPEGVDHVAVRSAYGIFQAQSSATFSQYRRAKVDFEHATVACETPWPGDTPAWSGVVSKLEDARIGDALVALYFDLTHPHGQSLQKQRSQVLFVHASLSVDGTAVGIVYPGVYVPTDFTVSRRPWHDDGNAFVFGDALIASPIYRDYSTNSLVITYKTPDRAAASAEHPVVVCADVLLDASGYITGLFAINLSVAIGFAVVFWRYYVRSRHAFSIWLLAECACLSISYVLLGYTALVKPGEEGVRSTVEMLNRLLPSTTPIIGACVSLWAGVRARVRYTLIALVLVIEISSGFTANHIPLLPPVISLVSLLLLSFTLLNLGQEQPRTSGRRQSLTDVAITLATVTCGFWGLSQVLVVFLYPELEITQWLRAGLRHVWESADLYAADIGIFTILLAAKMAAFASLAFLVSQVYLEAPADDRVVAPSYRALVTREGIVASIWTRSFGRWPAVGSSVLDLFSHSAERNEIAESIRNGASFRQMWVRCDTERPMFAVDLRGNWQRTGDAVIIIRPLDVDPAAMRLRMAAVTAVIHDSVAFKQGNSSAGGYDTQTLELLRDAALDPVPSTETGALRTAAEAIDSALSPWLVDPRTVQLEFDQHPPCPSLLLRIRKRNLDLLLHLLSAYINSRSSDLGEIRLAVAATTTFLDESYRPGGSALPTPSGIELTFNVQEVDADPKSPSAVAQRSKPFASSPLPLFTELVRLEDGECTWDEGKSRSTLRIRLKVFRFERGGSTATK